MGMARVDCGNCRHDWNEHEKVPYGPTRCKVEGCDCCQGPAQRDDLVDVIEDMSSFLNIIKCELSDINRGKVEPAVRGQIEAMWNDVASFMASLEARLRRLETGGW